MKYAELNCASHFSFLRGVSSCDELFARGAELGLEALAITDRNTLSGIVRAHEASRASGLRLIVGCRLDLSEGSTLLVYPRDRTGYAGLCRLLSTGKRRAGKGGSLLGWEDVAAYSSGLVGCLIPDMPDERLEQQACLMKDTFGDRGYLSLTLRRRPGDQVRLRALSDMARRMGLLSVVTGDVLYHRPDRRPLQDVVTCIREGCTIDTLGFRRERMGDQTLNDPAEVYRLYAGFPDAIERTVEIAEACRFSLDELAYQYPDELDGSGLTSQETLERLTWTGAGERYPDGVPEGVCATLRHELDLIRTLDYAPYFLTVNSIVRFARGQGILCQGRGSAANSAVCYVLGITSIDPDRNDLLFERFISLERREPPDIDVDFEHDRREIVMQWVFDTYGRNHAALCSTVIRYRARGAIRDVGKALGLSEDMIRLLSSSMSRGAEGRLDRSRLEEIGLNPGDRRLRLALDLAHQLTGAPRHLSQHPGGFVLTRDRLDELCPIEPAAMDNRQVIEWDKDDIDALKFMKVDCLALGMLSCMKRCFDLLAEHKESHLDLARIPPEDPATYAMIRKADTIGVFQIESRAQMAMLPRIKPRTFYDLVIEVAIVRPGPIQGDMVHPYLRRREGREKIEYPTPELERVLGKTLGVPLFQEQAMRVAIECAGFTPGEADQLRRAMATFKFTGGVGPFREKLIHGMIARGYPPAFAERTFRQLEGFGSYGFPESHAASFALIAYASSWMKCHHPDVFCAGLLNAQPMGFYAPAQIVRDAQEHGVDIRPVCLNTSQWDCTLEETGGPLKSVRLGMRLVKGLASRDARALIAARGLRPFTSLEDLWRRSDLPNETFLHLAEADAFSPSLGLSRREARWAIRSRRPCALPLFEAADKRETTSRPEIEEPQVALKPMTLGQDVTEDYQTTGLSLKRHPISFLRDDLERMGVKPCAAGLEGRSGASMSAAGLVLIRQRPGSAKGVMFLTLEDETGILNLIIWPKVFERNRRLILSSSMLLAEGTLQKAGEVVHLIVRRVEDGSEALAAIGKAPLQARLGRGDEYRGQGASSPLSLPGRPSGHYDQTGRNGLRPRSRDFR